MSDSAAIDDYQTAFKDFLLNESKQSLQPYLQSREVHNEVSSECIEERLSVYKNNMYFSLSEALGSLYPVTKRLVGDDFFLMLAKQYINEHPPLNPIISFYGENFPSFISAQESCQALAYLSDVSNLEWFSHRALHAKDEEGLELSSLANYCVDDLPCLYFSLLQSAKLIHSGFCIDEIWLENQQKEVSPLTEIKRSTFILVYRQNNIVQMVSLKAEVYGLLEQLNLGKMLGDAWQVVKNKFGLEDDAFSGMLSYLLGLNVFGQAGLIKLNQQS